MKTPAFAVLIILLSLLSTFAATTGQTDSGLVINEFMADNDGAVGGPYMTYPDWIELYNGGNSPVDLSGMFLTEELGVSAWQFPNGTVMDPGSFLLVWGGRGSGPGMLHANFSPNAGGGNLTLLSSDGETLIDQISFGKQLRDVSFGRFPDGSSSWIYMTTPTAGDSNVKNPQPGVSINWPVWAFIVSFFVVCILYVLKGKVRPGRKND